MGWDRTALPQLIEYLDITDIDAASAWAAANGKADYRWARDLVSQNHQSGGADPSADIV